MQSLKKIRIWLILSSVGLGILIFISSFGLGYVSSGENTTQIRGQLVSYDDSRWDRKQYDFFQTTCLFNETIQIKLDYYGDADVDILIFVDEETETDAQRIYAWDIAHCGFDSDNHVPVGKSTKIGTNTDTIGSEIVYYTNSRFQVTRNVYILVYIERGLGISDYTLTSSQNIISVPSENYEKCWTVLQAWGVFGLGVIIILIIFIRWAKKAAMTPEQRAALEKAKADKFKAKSKGNVEKQGGQMKARKGQTRKW